MKNEPKTALIIGATGLVGKQLLELLLKDERYSSVIAFTRYQPAISHPKLKYIVTDFKNCNEFRDKINGNDLFCCLGTTRKKSKNIQQYRFVDYDIPVTFATIAKDNGATGVYCVSSIGANAESMSFYLKLKGEMEQSILQIGFQKCAFLRPSMLVGKRDEKRIMEDLAVKVFRFSGFLFFGRLNKYKPINASTVARAMLKIAKSDFKEIVFENNRIKEIVGEKS